MVCVVFIMLFFRWLHPSITFYKIIMVVSIAMYILITPLLEQVSQFLPVHYAVYTQAYLDAVSYTHLDVYKRQPLGPSVGRGTFPPSGT